MLHDFGLSCFINVQAMGVIVEVGTEGLQGARTPLLNDSNKVPLFV